MPIEPQPVDVTLPDGTKQSMFLTVNEPSWSVHGWFDEGRGLWVHEVHHEDGTVERWLSSTIVGPFTPEKP